MIKLIALAIWALFTWQLFRWNREPDAKPSKALWVPAFWLFIASSRNVTAWLQYSGGGSQSDEYLEGSPVDRAVLTLVLAIGVIILIHRGRKAFRLLEANTPILVYFSYCALSALWSDYPDVSFKRWFRAIGDLVMVLVVLSDRDWVVAMRRLLGRLGIWLVPLSILFIRYFPELGRSYSRGGAPSWTGVATDKNALGMLSMIFGLAAIYRLLQLYKEAPKGPETRRQVMAQSAIVVMTFYLLWEANSATAFSCYFLAGIPMILSYLFPVARKTASIHLMVATALLVSSSALFLGVGSGLVQDLGRDSTLTGRTDIWRSAFTLVRNPILGTGYESFWLGQRLASMEYMLNQGINQAHDGYIEVYLNLGWVGEIILLTILITGYRAVVKAVRNRSPMGNLLLAYFVATVAYNFTEAGFKMTHPMWIVFLMAVIAASMKRGAEDPLPARGPGAGTLPELASKALPVGLETGELHVPRWSGTLSRRAMSV